MATGHPRDESGRVLPHPWWPAERQAPGELELVRRFCNSINRENGAERFGDATGLDRWLLSEKIESVGASPAGLARVITLREVLHRLVLANGNDIGTDNDIGIGVHDDRDAWDDLVAATHRVSFRVARAGDAIELQPTGPPLDLLIGRIVTIVVEAVADGSWPRLKACRHCHWIVFDPSKNRSARWCSMTACGGRHNARQYRQRNRATRSVG